MGFSGPPSEPDVRLPPHPALHVFMPLVRVTLSSARSTMVWGCGRPVAVALDVDLVGPEHLDPFVADPPARQVAADHGAHAQPRVALAEPADDPPEGEVV